MTMSYQVNYYAYGREFNDVFIGGTPRQIKEMILDYCPTAHFESFTPSNTSEDEIKESHTEVEIGNSEMAVYRAQVY